MAMGGSEAGHRRFAPAAADQWRYVVWRRVGTLRYSRLASDFPETSAVVQLLRRPDKGRNVQVQALPAPLLFGSNRPGQVFYSMHQLVEAAKML